MALHNSAWTKNLSTGEPFREDEAGPTLAHASARQCDAAHSSGNNPCPRIMRKHGAKIELWEALAPGKKVEGKPAE
jgi:hypothetical protein